MILSYDLELVFFWFMNRCLRSRDLRLMLSAVCGNRSQRESRISLLMHMKMMSGIGSFALYLNRNKFKLNYNIMDHFVTYFLSSGLLRSVLKTMFDFKLYKIW